MQTRAVSWDLEVLQPHDIIGLYEPPRCSVGRVGVHRSHIRVIVRFWSGGPNVSHLYFVLMGVFRSYPIIYSGKLQKSRVEL